MTGGVLYALAEEYGDFFNCVLNDRMPGKGTGIAEWDNLFEGLHNSGYRKNIVPCMVGVSVMYQVCTLTKMS